MNVIISIDKNNISYIDKKIKAARGMKTFEQTEFMELIDCINKINKLVVG